MSRYYLAMLCKSSCGKKEAQAVPVVRLVQSFPMKPVKYAWPMAMGQWHGMARDVQCYVGVINI